VVGLAYTFALLSQFITGSLQEFIMVGIKNKVIAITGASSVIGEAMAVSLSQLGAKLVLGARGTERLEKLTASIVAVGGDAVCVTTDVTRREDLVRLVTLALERYQRLDVLVSNAGIGPLPRFDDLKVDEWDMMIDVNLRGVLHGIAAALPMFRQQGFGHFVNVVSTAGIKIIPLQGVYAATKNAVRTINEALRQEAGDKLRVTGILPGFVRTNFADSMSDLAVKALIAERMEKIAISPDAIAHAIAFAINQPTNVDVGDIVIRPTAQD
jgi:NADP-dependent 3-hydroxy acid dehydrogenase YdfG